ncbi:class I SAM-dependent methyltransferase (plasmid) [Streptomyces sp. NBC_01795]|uniref:class I SAM-dependent methyltransferase n=1 Tax=unclassified Streptomyces TaxID=2593676 RepID=UPI002DDC02E3|nr:MULTISPECIES: class I SAM-dependent methyltransferase [unclassified Streptomyces]WSA97560.1 class I SAM-dependent methyltransferase [Streptomyces sp. NBC_01795]WSB82192.1 class I SAM-dependent methyltransferase [Streptomyces sp. NBC_01775]WSS18163.1 class I SAM-dependent methyltransferase [Streptomyces sp. NBC_01186]
MPHPPVSLPAYWDLYKPYRGEGDQPPPPDDRFDWTQYPGHGPGAELLGPCTSALELGPGEGAEAAYLAQLGVHVTAIDLSPVQTERARRFWAHLPGLDFLHAEACAYLQAAGPCFDAIYSNWGAVWFTDPEELMPRILRRLAPGGTLVFSQAEPGDAHGPQQMGGRWLEGRERELTVQRWQYTPQAWTGILKRHGYTDINARTLPAPQPGRFGTLLVQAHRDQAS